MLSLDARLEMTLQKLVSPITEPRLSLDESELLILPSISAIKVRLSRVRARLWETPIDGSTLVNYASSTYLEWVRDTEYLILGKYDPLEGYVEFVGVKASKRGNDVYAKRVRDRWAPLMKLPDVHFFNYKDQGRNHLTRALFVTLTYAPKGKTIGEAWESVGEDWNRFITRARKEYGGVQVARVWESMKNGYPHIHAIMLFDTKEFNAFHHNEAWRVYGKSDLAKMWDHGFSDVEALSSTKGGFHYVAKYLGKLHELGHVPNPSAPKELEYGELGSNLGKLTSRASVLTLSLMWIHRKRAFSISGELSDSIRALHNSNQDSDFYALLQVDLDGGAPPERVTRWVLCGFFAGELIKGGKVRWSVELSPKDYMKIRNSESYSNRLEVFQ